MAFLDKFRGGGKTVCVNSKSECTPQNIMKQAILILHLTNNNWVSGRQAKCTYE